ncbi:phospholipase D-like domain-containing protein [Chlamydia pecorum]|uniref:phospholipase D-like domain-containing protein n=1 Tax=Chlamydia pecorum TaxID=85991 RepID=UPI0003AE51F3|nr:phospholipase D-like domain-containing protein [Chlamydia pecorum]AGW39888.1 phospholipase D family protein [Chlamydia pecorum P787]
MSTRSIGGGGGPSGSRYHPYIRDDHHRSSREEVSRRSRDHHRRHGSNQRSRIHGHHGHRSRETERGPHQQHRHHEDIESRVSSLAIPRLRSSEERIRLFSAHQHTYNQPIEMICSAIEDARKQIFLKIYHIASEKIILSLVKQARNVPTHVQYQESPNIEALSAGSSIVLEKRHASAILHKKTLCIDESLVISGSANYTELSLQKDVNLTLRMRGSMLYEMVSRGRRGTVNVGDQQVIYHPITRVRGRGDNYRFITSEIIKAKSSILISMYALNQKEILSCLEQALLRGVYIKIIVDAKESCLLQNITQDMKIRSCIYERTCEETLHTKACCVDSRVLICGSANWTGAGLNKNLEDLFIVYPLTETQLQCFLDIWKYLESNSKLVFPDSEVPSTSV